MNPMDIQTSSAVFWTCLKAVSIWLLSMLLAVPEAIFSQVVHMQVRHLQLRSTQNHFHFQLYKTPGTSVSPQGHRDNMNVTFVNCVPYPLSNQMHPKIHSVMIFLVYFLIPLTIISVYYYHIARTLIRSAHDMPGEVSEHTKKQVSSTPTPESNQIFINRSSHQTDEAGLRFYKPDFRSGSETLMTILTPTQANSR